MNGHAGAASWTLDHNAADSCLLEAIHQICAKLDVFMKQLPIVTASIPARVPCPVDADTQADWLDFLTHPTALLFHRR